MVETQIEGDRFFARFNAAPTVEEIQALVTTAKDSVARIRIISLTVPLTLQSKSDWMDLLTREWERVGNVTFLLNIGNDNLRVHPDPKVAAMRSGLGI